MAIARTKINGRRYSFSSLECTLVKPGGDTEIFIDISEISYSHALTMEFVRGAARRPLDVTAGDYEPADGSITMTKSKFTTGIVEGIGAGWMGATVKFVCKYADVGEPLTTDEVTCILMGEENAHSAGPSPLNVKVALKILEITTNGVNPLGDF